MRPEDRDAAWLWDMREAARAVIEFTKGVSFHHYQGSSMLRSAVERKVEIIGEAAVRVSAGFRESHPEIPWQRIIGQRNILIHEYGEIVDEQIYQVAVKHVPDLVDLLEPLIPNIP